MAIKQLVNWLGQQRVDIPDLRAIESGIIFDFKSLIQCFVGDTPYILRGFTIPVTGISGPATSLQLVVDSAVVWLPDDQNGSFLRVESGTPNEILSPSNTKVVGSFSPGANFVSIRFNRATDPSTNDLVSVWDVDSQTEFTETAPRGLVMNYEIVIDGSTFGNNAPVAIVNVSGSNVTSIKNCKQGLFRLGTGGANPNISNVWSYAVDPENNLLATSNASPDPFTGGDWELQNFKNWADAVMTQFKILQNSTFWYGTNTLVPNANISDLFWDLAGSKITGKGAWQHSSVTPGMLTWTSDVNMRSIFGTMSLTVTQGSVTLSDGDVAYLNLVRNQDFQSANTFSFTNGSTTVNAAINVTGISAGDFIKYEADNLTAWTKVQSVGGTVITLANAYPGGTYTGKALRTQGTYTMQTASPNNVPVSQSTYWIAKRDDNAFASLTIQSPGSNGLTRASDVSTLITTTNHGLVVGQSFAISGASDPSFDGFFTVQSVPSATSVTFYNGGSDVSAGSAGNGTVSSVPKIYMRMSGGVGELEQGESIQIDDETSFNIMEFIGMEDETQVNPPYSILPNAYSTHTFDRTYNLTRAISEITGNVNDIFTSLNAPAYDEPLVVVSGAPASSNEVTGPITSGSLLTLPDNSRMSGSAQNYVVGRGGLELYLNGQRLTQNTYGSGAVSSFYSYGMSGPWSSDLALNGSLVGGAAVEYTPGANQNFTQMKAMLAKSIAGGTGNLYCKVRNNSGGVPGATVYGVSNAVAVSTLSTSASVITFAFSSSVALTSGTAYWFTIETDATYQGSPSPYVIWYQQTGSGQPNAVAGNNGSSWASELNNTPAFELDGVSATTIGNGWLEYGTVGLNSTQIQILQNLVVDDVLSFRLTGTGGPSTGSGAPDDDFHNKLSFSTSTNSSNEVLIWDADASAYRKQTRANFLAGVSNLKQGNTYAANHTASTTLDDVILMNAAGGPLTLFLPAAASAQGKTFDIKKIDATGNSVTIQANGIETIDGSNTITLTTQYQSRSVFSDGVNWWII